MRQDRLFLTAIGISLAVHIGALAVISLRTPGESSAAPEAQFLPVEFGKAAAPVAVQKPRMTPAPPPPVARATAVTHDSGSAPRPQSASMTRPAVRTAAAGHANGLRVRVASGGGALNYGGSPHGTVNLGTSGNTPMGWVPGEGSGRGSGDGPGTGSRAPMGDSAAPPAPAPAPPQPAPQPPAPKEIHVRVCEVSGEIPGQYCRNTVVKTFVEGHEPTRACTRCKAPEPPPETEHHSMTAEVVKERLLSGPNPSIPRSVRQPNIDARVTCQWTVEKDGSVSDVRITAASGIDALDEEVVDCVKRRKHAPATQDGEPRSVRKSATFVFRR